MRSSNYEYETAPDSRPSFLTWLCILTFIGSGWAIVSSVYTYTSVNKYANILSREKSLNDTFRIDSSSTRKGKENGLSKKVKASFSKVFQKDNLRKLALGNMVAALLTLGGALLMWKLRRMGFYFYISGVVLSLAVPFYIFCNDFIAVGATSFNNFFGLVFIALYALNLKAMR